MGQINNGGEIMKLKHWHGYGSVNAKVTEKSQTYTGRFIKERVLRIKVWGNHERGLEINTGDKYELARWLGKLGGFLEEEIKAYHVEHRGYEKIDNVSTEVVVYVVFLHDKAI
jgi:hypothetical protein